MFETIIKLFLVGMVPVVVSVAARAIDKYTKFGSLKNIYKQLIYGLVFGLLSIFGSECGVKTVNNAVINVRDVAPVCAGLMFGTPAGIIAGVIGGTERFFAVYWGAGTVSRYACSIATVCAGLWAALIRSLIFDKHHGRWYYGFVSGLFVESFHMLLVFVTNMKNIETAYNLVHSCAIPMIIANSVCITLSLIGVAIVSNEPLISKERPRKISFFVQIGLMLSILSGFVLIGTLTYSILNNLSISSTTEQLTVSIDDIKNDVKDAVDEKIMYSMTGLIEEVDNDFTKDKLKPYTEEEVCQKLDKLADLYKLSEISIIGFNNKIVYSTTREYIGYDMYSGEQSLEFWVLLYDSGIDYYIQELRPNTKEGINMKYAGARMSNKNFAYLQIGLNEVDYHYLLDVYVDEVAENRHVGKTGYLTIIDEKGKIVSTTSPLDYSYINPSTLTLNTLQKLTFNGENVYQYIVFIEGFYILSSLPIKEADLNKNISLYVTTLTEVIIFCSMYILIYVLIKKIVVNRIHNTNKKLEMISSGNLDIKVDENNTYEFNLLSEDINKTVDALKEHIKAAAEKIEADLSLAKDIQHSVLPSTFPPFPTYHEFDIFASMNTAKEVGGDFYDFYLIDPTHLAIMIADVSGKGIPAAMFMMQSKTILKSLAETGIELDKAMTLANQKLCEGNDAQMFVTCWMGIVDLETGHVTYVNAGHNPILIGRNDGTFEYLKSRAGFVLAGMDSVKYRLQEFDLNQGEYIYLYTDGVTEATNNESKLYGEDRLLKTCNDSYGLSAESFSEAVLEDVNKFVDGAEQADDITMLTFKYYGKRNLEEIKVDAEVKNVEKVTQFVDAFLEKNDCTMKANTQIDVAIDEIYSNIANYAYEGMDKGKVNVIVEVVGDDAFITFEDHGMPYNPLLKDDPDVTLSIDEREVGGLGIFMVKKTMDDVIYHNTNGRNILTLKKRIHL